MALALAGTNLLEPLQVEYAQKIYPFFEQVERGVRTRLKGSFQAAPKLPSFGEGNMAMEKFASIAIALAFIRASIGESLAVTIVYIQPITALQTRIRISR
ncbi:MAG: hypothetical protein F9K25_09980 [Candidatus Contendobacter sp.]|nr:MAG: hypothetical protein F9K25_09980 [Candidatus Contendobacter sp.]